MGSKRNVTDRRTSLSLDDPVDTEEWHCALGLVIEKNASDCNILNQFPKAAFRGLRQEVKSIDYEFDVVRIIKQFINGAIDYKYSFLLNFSSTFEEAAEVIKREEALPVHLLVKIVKALILLHRKNDFERRERKRLHPYDPIQSMAARPAVINNNKKGTEKLDKKVAGPVGKLKPPSVGKEDTKLLKRGEGSKEYAWIDDAPVNSYYQMYIVLTGFYDPNFPLELIKTQVNLSSVICIDGSSPNAELCNTNTVKRFPSPNKQLSNCTVKCFWDEFLKIIWNPEFAIYFKDTVFQMYTPNALPYEITDLQDFLYNEISFLMYDLSDLKRQHNNYLEHLNLLNVTEIGEKVEQIIEYQEELDELPAEFVTVPLVLQYILDVLCGEDDVRDDGMQKVNYASLESEAPSMYTKKTGSSLITSTSTTPNISDIFVDDIRKPIYQKFKELDVEYGLADDKSLFEFLESHKELSYISDEISVLVPKQRLYAENLEDALRAGLKQKITKSCWKSHEFWDYNCKYPEVQFPPIIMDYCLYVLWLSKVVCSYSEEEKKWKPSTNGHTFPSQPCFTITETARKVLNKHEGFFSSPDLKIVDSSLIQSCSKIETKEFVSDFNIPKKYFDVEMNVYEDLRSFLGEDFFADENGFEFIEEFSKSKMEEILEEAFGDYNCVDCSHSALTDSIFLVLHKRKDEDGIQRGSYSVSLRTAVGLRDFYDYVIEDEKDWLSENEEIHKGIQKSEAELRSFSGDFRNFRESDFIMENSLKSQRITEDSLKSFNEIQKEISNISAEKVPEPKPTKMFTGYEVSPMAVQISGLNSYFSASDNCSVAVELEERLYGKQELRLQIRQGGHILYLYSYVCPQPHLFDPYTCHLLYKNGIVVAFTRRTNVVYIEVEEVVPLPPVKAKSRKSLQEKSSIIVKRIPMLIKDEDFFYDMKLSFPTGLTVETVRKHVEPCYIKQKYLVRPGSYSKTVQNELSRLFLPSGELIKMLSDNTIEILRGNAAIFDTYVEPEMGTFMERTTPSGEFCRINDLNKETCRRFQIFENIDVETNVVYFRRTDGTDYSLYPDGTFCVYFKDGTRMSTSFSEHDDHDDNSDEIIYGEGDNESEVRINAQSNRSDSYNSPIEYKGEGDGYSFRDTSSHDQKFVIVYLKRIFEHPDYATVLYDEFTKEWSIILPDDSVVKATQYGCYFVNIDDLTDFSLSLENIYMGRKNKASEFVCETFVDLTVFNGGDNKNYCVTRDASGSRFTVENNGNCYVDTYAEEESEGEGSQRTLSKENSNEEKTPEVEISQRKSIKENDEHHGKFPDTENRQRRFSKESHKREEKVAEEHDSRKKSVEEEKIRWKELKGNSYNEEKFIAMEKSPKSFSGEVKVYEEKEHKSENNQRKLTKEDVSFEEKDMKLENGQKDLSKESSLFKESNNKSAATQRKLSNENRYFVIRRDKSGFELVHKDKARQILSEIKDDVVYFEQTLPVPEERRFFVLLSPHMKYLSKWEIKSIIPDFDYKHDQGRKTLPSTYGVPPTWMHPFYEKKTEITIPDGITSRVFVELKKTDFKRNYTSKYKYCKIDEFYHEKKIEIEPGVKNIQRVIRKIAADDPALLHQIYVTAVYTEIESANSPRPIDYEKIKYYLEQSKYQNELKDFYKHSIRYQIVPNYFEHPAGFSWLILQEIVDSLNGQPWIKTDSGGEEPSESDAKVLSDEVVYNLEFPPQKNFSDLSYRMDLSAKSAPPVLMHRKDTTMKVEKHEISKSEPAIKYENLPKSGSEDKMWDLSLWDPKDLDKQPSYSCVFTEGDLDELESELTDEK